MPSGDLARHHGARVVRLDGPPHGPAFARNWGTETAQEVFATLGGFDEGYARPAIEYIELGARLRCAGYRVWLCPDVQVTHLKRWTFASLLRSDILTGPSPGPA